MPVHALMPKLIAATAAILALVVGLRAYTLPIHGGPTYGDIRSLLAHTLGDSEAMLPIESSFTTAPVDPLDPADPLYDPRPAKRAPAPPPAQPVDWARRAVAQDSAAVRAWLGDAVFVTAVVEGETVRTTFWRVTLTRGCPWLSRLHAVSARREADTGTLRLVDLTADCPVLLER